MTNSFDTYLYRLINQQLVSDTLDVVMFYASDKYFWLPLYAILIGILIYKFKRYSWLTILSLIVIVVITDRVTSGIMKPTFARVRPCHESSLTPRLINQVHCSDTGSMASSHAANHFGIAMYMFLLIPSSFKSRYLWLIWASIIAYSRVYLGVHYPTDVIVGAGLGLIIGYFIFIIYSKIITSKKWA